MKGNKDKVLTKEDYEMINCIWKLTQRIEYDAISLRGTDAILLPLRATI